MRIFDTLLSHSPFLIILGLILLGINDPSIFGITFVNTTTNPEITKESIEQEMINQSSYYDEKFQTYLNSFQDWKGNTNIQNDQIETEELISIQPFKPSIFLLLFILYGIYLIVKYVIDQRWMI